MRKELISKFCVLFVILFTTHNAMAQSLEVVEFKKDFRATDYDLSELDINQYASLFVFNNRKLKLSFEANLGIIRQFVGDDHMQLLLLPTGTSSIKISCENYPILNYEFPNALEKNEKYMLRLSAIPNENKEEKIVTIHRPSYVKSTDIELSNFKFNSSSLFASFSPEYDNNGQACAVIRYTVDSEGFVIEPNLGTVKMIEKPGEIIQYVPAGTKRLTVRNGNYMPIRDYEIPMELQSKGTYDVNLSLTEYAIKRQKASPDHENYLGVGYNNPNFSFGTKGGSRRFTIHCNSTWDISAPSWCKLSKTTGQGMMEIEVETKSNSTGLKRRGVIGIQSQDITVTIDIEQDSK